MKAKAGADEAVVEFTGKVQRMARVHHYGLRDRPARGVKEVLYEARPLLGFNKGDLEDIQTEVIKFLNDF